jgi:murein L,D-transpeptidase YcbB/YkuD
MKGEFYHSLDPEAYKRNKVEFLNTQVQVLDLTKRINTLRVLRKQKKELKKQLLKSAAVIKSDLDIIEEKFPEFEAIQLEAEVKQMNPAQVARLTYAREVKKIMSDQRQVKTLEQQQKALSKKSLTDEAMKRDRLEKELREIQEKLRQLASR